MWILTILLSTSVIPIGCLADPSIPDHPLHNRLKTWEVLKADDLVFHRQKRSLDDPTPPLDRQVSFKAFNQKFILSLMSSNDMLSPNFQAAVANSRGRFPIDIDKTTFYIGKVLGDEASYVNAHIDDRTMTAQISTDRQTYIIEPSWRHEPVVPGPVLKKQLKKQSPDMIVYKEQDMLKNFSRPHGNDGFCDTDKLMRDKRNHNRENTQTSEEYFGEVLSRRKREAGGRNKICNLHLYADYKFFMNMGNGVEEQAIYYLIQLIGRVNQIYKNTNWDVENKGYAGEFMDYGFQIDNITVYDETTLDPRFNSAKDDWNSNDLLEAFSEMKHEGLCLAHLFTYIDFDNGVLGLAYVGSDKAEDVGGICTKEYSRGSGKMVQYLNTGLTTTLNWGQRILTREADLVTTHELGHNFGAEHDIDDIKECSPGQSRDGNYVMYPAAVSGEYENNKKFSNCSIHSIYRALVSKAPKCFKEEKKAFCGNYKLEEGEQCDVGYIGQEEHFRDRCCNGKCELKPGAKCSSQNHECCDDNCQPAKTTTLCYSEVEDLCYRDTFCDGANFTCPKRRLKLPGSKCGDMGQCNGKGVCDPFCKTVGMQPCLCSQHKEEYCLRCCAPSNARGKEIETLCKPYKGINETTILLRNNTRCILGHCRNTVCVKQTQDVIERVWDIFEHIAPNKIGQFLANNIVGAVLVFSVLFWVPCGCLIHFVDKKREKHRQSEHQWWSEKGNDFTRNNSHITGSMFLPAPPSAGINNRRTNWGGGVMKLGMGAKEQWKQSQERGLAVRRSIELGDGDATPSNLHSSDSSLQQPLAQSSPPMPRPSTTNQYNNKHVIRPQVTSESQVTHRPVLQRQDNALDETVIDE